MTGAAELADLLVHGELEVEGRLVHASNTTLYARLTLDGQSAGCVYKPVAGERPLWDFPDGTLAGREVAAYLLSTATGWDIVPPTVLRDGPFGPGMCQLWVDIDEEAPSLVDVLRPDEVPGEWRPVLDAVDTLGEAVVLAHADDPRLRRIAVLDVVLNNADRKGGHILPGPGGDVHGVDHGVCLHAEPKLRTVLWGWAGEPLCAEEVEVLQLLAAALDGALGTRLEELVSPAEVRACHRRVAQLLRSGRLPRPGEGWPAIPWPPF